jgi:hypothetical protein
MAPVVRAARLFALCVVAATPAAADAQFTRVAHTTTQVPGQGVNFGSFGIDPSVSGGAVAFRGVFSGTQNGVYTWSGGTLQTIATSATTIPGTSVPFGPLGSPVVAGSAVTFAGGQAAPPPDPIATFRGIYTAPTSGAGPITRVVDVTTPYPPGSNPPPGLGAQFAGFTSPPFSGGPTVQFAGATTSAFGPVGGVFTAPQTGGSATSIAQTGTPTPNAPPGFFMFGFFAGGVSDGRVVFVGASSPGGPPPPKNGVYTAATTGGPLTVVADVFTTNVPGTTQRFGQFGFASISGSIVAFTGGQTPVGPVTGVYANTGAGGSLVRIADTTMAAPGGTGNFLEFPGFAVVAGDDVVFLARRAGMGNGLGIYTNAPGTLTKVVATGDTVDGRTVNDLFLGPTGFDGTSVTFWAGFSDGSSGIYVTPVPIPEPTGVLAVAALAVGGAVARRRFGRRSG